MLEQVYTLWAGNQLYGIPSNEFTNELVPLDNLESDNCFYYQLKLCNDKNALFGCLENYLLKRLFNRQVDPLVYNIAKRIIINPTARH